MSQDTLVSKRELIQLLDRANEIEQQVFEKIDGEQYSFDDDCLNIKGLRPIFELLIPKAVWSKQDYLKTYSDLSILGTEKDKNDNTQLIIGIRDIQDNFISTSDAVTQLFTPMKLNSYANFLIDNDHLELMLQNFEYWFHKETPDETILIRTVKEKGQNIVRCFATSKYQPIDNHVLLYITCWALDKLKLNFRLVQPRLDHSSLKIDFLSDDSLEIPDIGSLRYGFKLLNSEAKEIAVEFHPVCELTNKDGSTASLIIDKPISIPHRGKNLDPIIEKLMQLGHISQHIERTIDLIKVARTSVVDEFMAYKIQNAIVEIVGKTAFREYAEKYNEVSSYNTYNLLEYFGRLSDIPYKDDDKEIRIKQLFWSVLSTLK